MNNPYKHKSEASMDKSALALWLRDIADAVEAGELPSESGPVSLEGFKTVKISLKPGFGDTVTAKLSVKFPKPETGFYGVSGEAGEGAPVAAPGAEGGESFEFGGLPKYKSLKKHMKQTFKAIGQALLAGQMPPELEARSFIADSRLMVSYPNKGDEFYAAYLEKTEAFEAALAAQDMEAMKALYQELNQLKRDCHSRYA